MRFPKIPSSSSRPEQKFHAPKTPNHSLFRDKPKEIAIDTECTGLHWAGKCRPFAISLAYYDSKGSLRRGYYDWPVCPNSKEPQYNGQKGLNYLSVLWRDDSVAKVFANAKFDIHMLWKAFGFFYPSGPVYDVLVAAWCCNTQEKSYGLNNLAEKYLDIPQDDQDELRQAVIKARRKVKTDNPVACDYWLPKYIDHSSKVCERYALRDAERTIKLWNFYKEGMNILNVRHTFDFEMEVSRVLWRAEERGVRFDEDKTKKELALLERDKVKEELFLQQHFCAPSLNVGSTKQLIPHIYNWNLETAKGIIPPSTRGLKISVEEFTKGGNPSLETPVLEKYRDKHPEINSLLKFRGLDTGRRYCENYLDLSVDDRFVSAYDLPWSNHKKAIHTSFNQISSGFDRENRTVTGRLSSSNPNLQNVADPEKSNGLFVTDARSFFGPRCGYRWYCIDYKQLEARIFAALANEPDMIAAFSDPSKDPFTELGNEIYKKRGYDFSEGKIRKITKNVFYCKIFCGGPHVLAKKYHVTPVEFAKQVLDDLGKAFPGIPKAQYKYQKMGENQGYVKTVLGRKIDIDPKFSYRAISYVVQGSAADLIKRAMVRIQKRLNEFKKSILDAYIVLTVHDELVFEVAEKHCFKWFLKELKQIMEDNSDVLSIPTPCEIEKTSTNWSSKAKEPVNL